MINDIIGIILCTFPIWGVPIFCIADLLLSHKEFLKEMKNRYNNNLITIDYPEFVKFFNISPEKYNLSKIKYGYIIYKNKNEDFVLVFNKKRDWRKALKQYEYLKLQQENDKSAKIRAKYLNNVISDVRCAKEKAKSYIDESQEIIKKLKENS